MRKIDLAVIEYFKKNEQIVQDTLEHGTNNTVSYGTLPGTRAGFTLYKYIKEDGNHLEFSPIDFVTWQKYKEYYNSPLYKALNES